MSSESSVISTLGIYAFSEKTWGPTISERDGGILGSFTRHCCAMCVAVGYTEVAKTTEERRQPNGDTGTGGSRFHKAALAQVRTADRGPKAGDRLATLSKLAN